MKKILLLALIGLITGGSAFSEIILQEDFTPAQEGTLPATLTAEWDAGTDVIVVSLETVGVPVDHIGGDGYVLRLADLGDAGYNFCFPSNYTTVNEPNNVVEAWAYFDFVNISGERDYGLFTRATADPGGGVYPLRAGYWFFVTMNSSWGNWVPPNYRAFILKRSANTWVQIGNLGTSDYTTGWHKLRLEAVGNTIKGYVDDNLEVIATDSEYTTGFAGMVYYNASANGVNAAGAFDNFLWLRVIPLVLTPSGTVYLTVGRSCNFSATGGTNNYTWSLSNDTVGSINTTAGPTVTFSAFNTGIVDLTVRDPGPPEQEQTATIVVVPTEAPLASEPKDVEIKFSEMMPTELKE